MKVEMTQYVSISRSVWGIVGGSTKNNEPIKLDYDYRLAAILRVMKHHQKTINHKDKRYKFNLSYYINYSKKCIINTIVLTS